MQHVNRIDGNRILKKIFDHRPEVNGRNKCEPGAGLCLILEFGKRRLLKNIYKKNLNSVHYKHTMISCRMFVIFIVVYF